MNPYLSSASLKRIARGQLFGKLGTVIGAFLVHTLCLLPVAFFAFLVLTLCGMLCASGTFYLAGLLIEVATVFAVGLLSAVLFYGEDFLYLKIAGGYDAYILDIFQGFREGFVRIILSALLPSGVISLLSVPFFVFFNRYIAEYLPHANEAAALLFTNDTEKLNDFVLQFAPVIRSMRYGILILFAGCILTGILFSQILFLLADYEELYGRQLWNANFRLMKGSFLRYAYVTLSFSLWFLLSLFSCIFFVAIWAYPYYKATMANFYLDMVRTKEERHGA